MFSALAAGASIIGKRVANNLATEGTITKEGSVVDRVLESLKKQNPEETSGKKGTMQTFTYDQVLNIVKAAGNNPAAAPALLAALDGGRGNDENTEGLLGKVRNILGTRRSDDPRDGLVRRGVAKSAAKASPYSRREDLPTRAQLGELHGAGIRFDDGEQGVFRAYGENAGYWVRTGIVKFYPLMSAQRTIANAATDTFTADVLEDGEVIGIYIGIEGSATDVEEHVTRLGGLAITGMKIGLSDMFTTSSGHMPAVVFNNESALQSQLRGHVTTERSKNLTINALNNGVSMNVLVGAVIELCREFRPLD